MPSGNLASKKIPKLEVRFGSFVASEWILDGFTDCSLGFHFLLSLNLGSGARALGIAADFLVDNGFVRKALLQPKTRNMVATVNLQKCINLERISEETNAIYEPEQFPGAILRLKTPYKATILLFASGKAVITGLKGSHQLNPTVHRLEEIILDL